MAIYSRLRVMVVDDDHDTIESFALLLDIQGHECVTALDGDTALQLTATFRPDVVLLDLALPHLDGYEVVRRMRQLPEAAAVPVWMMSGYAQEKDRQQALEAGADLFLIKPVDPEYLSKLLDETAALIRQAREAGVGSRELMSQTKQLAAELRDATELTHNLMRRHQR